MYTISIAASPPCWWQAAAAALGVCTLRNMCCRPCRWGHLHEYCSTEAALAALADMSVEEQLAALRAFTGAADAIDQDAASEAPDHSDVSGEMELGQRSTADDGNTCGGDAAAAAQEAGLEDQAGSSADAVSAGAEQASEASHREVISDGSGYMPQYRERFFTADGSSCAAGSGMLVSFSPRQCLLHCQVLYCKLGCCQMTHVHTAEANTASNCSPGNRGPCIAWHC